MNTLAFAPGGFSIPFPVIVLGMITGMTYGLLAVGLVLIYRTNRIINFAHGEIGAFAAAVFGLAATKWHVPYYAALPLALVLGGGVAAGAETAVIRRLRKAPRIMSIVATLGVGQFLLLFGAAVNNQAGAGALYPQPPGMPVFNIGALRMTQSYTGMLVLAPAVVVALAAFLRFHKFGLGIRSAAANPEAARLSGIFASRMSTLAWALAGALSTLTAILVLPSLGFTNANSFGPSLLLRALAGAVLARMLSLPRALLGGIALGIVEQLLLWNYPRTGLVEVALFVIILVALLVQRREAGREEEKGSWAAVQPWRPIPEELRRAWTIRNLGRIFGLIALVFAALLPLVITNSASIIMVGIMGFAIVGLSVGMITGLGGQLSLGQFALAAIGATVSWQVSRREGNFAVSILYAGLAAGGVGLLIGLPALRVRGLMLAVTTLSFALVVPAWLLPQTWMLGQGADPGRPIIAHHALNTGKSYYFFALGLLLFTFALARNVRTGGFGRLLVAVRDNEDNARAFTVRASLVKMQGFVLAGFVAGVGGVVYGHALSQIGSQTFPTNASVLVVAMTVIGGIGILAGPLLGALYIIGIPAFLPLDSAGLAATSLGWLILILYVPGGLAQLFEPLRDRLVLWLGARAGVTPSAEAQAEERAPSIRMQGEGNLRPAGTTLLEARGLHKRFGGLVAVDDVSLGVRSGEILGLIGPNGAGKTTLFELLSGFTRVDRGRVYFDGRDVTPLGPEQRGRRGLIRSFQDAALFPTLTVFETVRLAHERVLPTSLIASVSGLPWREREKSRHASELISLMGLDRYRDKQIQELSTGTRRITEIACLIALRPSLLLLDEPSSGIAQRETEALGHLLLEVKQQLNTTLVVIEHDIPLIMGLADRIIAMESGSVIAEGKPEDVRSNELVIEAYFGGSQRAIGRSGLLASGAVST